MPGVDQILYRALVQDGLPPRVARRIAGVLENLGLNADSESDAELSFPSNASAAALEQSISFAKRYTLSSADWGAWVPFGVDDLYRPSGGPGAPYLSAEMPTGWSFNNPGELIVPFGLYAFMFGFNQQNSIPAGISVAGHHQDVGFPDARLSAEEAVPATAIGWHGRIAIQATTNAPPETPIEVNASLHVFRIA